MQFVEVSCPRCTSHRVQQADHLHYRCLHCQSIFMRDAPPPVMPPPPHPVMPPPPPPVPVTSFMGPAGRGIPAQRGPNTSMTVRIVIAVSLFAVVVTAAVASGLSARRRRQAAADALLVKPTATMEAVSPTATFETLPSKGPPPKARLKTIRKGVTILGAPFWVVVYENTGDTPIGNAAVRVSLFDAGGHRLDEVSGYAVDKNLAPRQTTPILVLGKKLAGVTKEDIGVQLPEPPSSYDASQLAMTITEFSPHTENTMTDIVGTVKNPTKQTVRFIHVVAVGLDARGEAVSYSDTFASAKELAPGGASGFKVSSGTFDAVPPARYELFSIAMPAR